MAFLISLSATAAFCEEAPPANDGEAGYMDQLPAENGENQGEQPQVETENQKNNEEENVEPAEEYDGEYEENVYLEELPPVDSEEVQFATILKIPKIELTDTSLIGGIAAWLCVAVGIAVIVGVLVSRKTSNIRR